MDFKKELVPEETYWEIVIYLLVFRFHRDEMELVGLI